MRVERGRVCFVISLLMHLTILGSGLLTGSDHKRFKIAGSEQAVQAYLLYEAQQPRQQEHQSSIEAKANPLLLSRSAKKVLMEKPTTKPKPLKKTKPQLTIKKDLGKPHKKLTKPATNRRERGLQGEELNQLVILLYRAINQHKLYPAQARVLALKGTVTLSFLLSSSGQVSDIHIQHGSGQSILDQAAITTLKRSQPFHGAGRYLKHAQRFLIPVKYG